SAGLHKIVFRIELLVAVVFVSPTVKLVCTRLADLNNNGAAGFAILCRHAVLLDAKLPDGLDGRLNILTAKHRRCDRGAIQNIFIIAGPTATNAYFSFVGATRASKLLRHPGSKGKKVIGTSPATTLGWQFLQSGCVESLPEIGLLRLQQRRVLRPD